MGPPLCQDGTIGDVETGIICLRKISWLADFDFGFLLVVETAIQPQALFPILPLWISLVVAPFGQYVVAHPCTFALVHCRLRVLHASSTRLCCSGFADQTIDPVFVYSLQLDSANKISLPFHPLSV